MDSKIICVRKGVLVWSKRVDALGTLKSKREVVQER